MNSLWLIVAVLIVAFIIDFWIGLFFTVFAGGLLFVGYATEAFARDLFGE